MQEFAPSAEYVLKFINQTNRSIFLTGKAGTGKTTLLREIIMTTHKNAMVVAPTGIAALNAGGVTIHSLFQLPLGGFIPVQDEIASVSDYVKFESRDSLRKHFFKMNKSRRSLFRNLELLIIDEVSMLRADLLDAMDFVLQSIRKNSQVFGGVQVLFIGDLLQLPPVVKNQEWDVLRKYYSGKFFFHAHAIQKYPPLYIELTKIYRQSDDTFISILNNLRNNTISSEDLKCLNQFINKDFDLKANKGYITLTTHNAKADNLNSESLAELSSKKHIYPAEITGDFPEKIFPLEQNLELKVGAQIMFVKNDLSPEKRFFNGKTGVVKFLNDSEMLIEFPEEGRTIEVEKYEWKNIRYTVNESTKEIEEELFGTFVQYPVKLAWAITVHKSQGLTFDKAALDVSDVFMPGQAYVALSRLRSLKGLVLLSELRMNGISNDMDVMKYADNKADEESLGNLLHSEPMTFVHMFMNQAFNFKQLGQEWRNHVYSYKQDVERSEKSKHYIWAKTQLDSIDKILDASEKFQTQLNRLFLSAEADVEFISGRINAAFGYFFAPMDTIVYNLLYKIQQVKNVKKVKAFYDELTALEEIQTKAVLQLFRAQKMIEAVVRQQPISKETLTSEEIKSYIQKKKDKIKLEFNTNHPGFLEESDFHQYEAKKKSTTSAPKKSTIQETYEMWQTKKSVDDIAAERKLTPQTIYTHLSKLVQTGAVQLNDVLTEDKIKELAEAFHGYSEESLGPLKEKYGEKFSYNELRLYKASLN